MIASQLEVIGAIAAPSLVLAGVVVKALFDWRVNKATEHRITAEGLKTHAEAKLTEAQVPKIDAEAAKIIADTAVNTAVALIAPLKQQIAELSARVDALEAENTTMTGQLRRAHNYIRDLLRSISVLMPDWTPPPFPDGLGLLL